MKTRKVLFQGREIDVPVDHKLVTRRDFLSHGLITFASTFAMPSFLGFITRKAMAACDMGASGASRVPFLVLDLAGGPNIAGKNVFVGSLGSKVSGKLADTNLLGVGQYRALTVGQPNKANLVTTYGLPLMPSGGNTNWASGMNAATTAVFNRAGNQQLAGLNVTQFRDRVDGVLIPVRTDDDSNNNALNPMYWIAKSGTKGELTALLGTANTESGGRSIAPPASINTAMRPVRVVSAEQAAQLANLGALTLAGGAGLTAAQAERVLRAAGGMSQSQLDQFQSLELKDQVKELVNCGYVKASAMTTAYTDPNTFRYQNDAVLNTVFTDPQAPAGVTGDYTELNQQLGTMMKLLLDGYAGGATITVGNMDYHGRGAGDNNQRDHTVGYLIGKALAAAAAKNKPLMIYIFTDGGVVSNDGGSFSADNGSRSATAMFFYDPKAPRGASGIVSANQLGSYSTATGQVDTGSSLVANSLSNLARVVVGNYLALHGEQGKLAEVTGANPFADRMDAYVLARKIV